MKPVGLIMEKMLTCPKCGVITDCWELPFLARCYPCGALWTFENNQTKPLKRVYYV